MVFKIPEEKKVVAKNNKIPKTIRKYRLWSTYAPI